MSQAQPVKAAPSVGIWLSLDDAGWAFDLAIWQWRRAQSVGERLGRSYVASASRLRALAYGETTGFFPDDLSGGSAIPHL